LAPMPEPTISAEQLSRLSGFTIIDLVGLSRQGYFPRARDGVYEQNKAIPGCFKACQEKLKERSGLPTYQSMAECATQTGIPRSVLKAARKESAESFRAHRILLGPLLKWIFSRDGDGVDWGLRDKRATALIKEHALEKVRDKTLDKGEVTFGLHKVMALLFATLDKASDTLPAILGGMDASGIKFKLTESNEALKAELRGGFEALFRKQK
jgi:hypothetical protein